MSKTAVTRYLVREEVIFPASYDDQLRERFIEKKEEKKLTNVSFALTPTYVQ